MGKTKGNLFMSADRKKRYVLLALALLMLCSAAGCQVVGEYPAPLPVENVTPPPLVQDETLTFEAGLYFISEDGLRLHMEKRQVQRQEGESYAQAALGELCRGPMGSALQPVIPEGLTFSHVELAGSVCNVYLTGELPEEETRFLAARAAIAATVAYNEDVVYTDVYVNGIQPGYQDRPLGLAEPIDTALDAYLSDLQQSIAGETMAEAAPFDSRSIALYFTDTSRNHLVADVRTINYNRTEELTTILNSVLDELAKGPLGSEGRESILPAGMRLKEQKITGLPLALPQEEGPEDAESSLVPQVPVERIAELYFESPAEEYEEELVYGAIVYTVMGFCPQVEGVRMYFDGDLVDAASFREGRGKAYFTREDFKEHLGHTVKLAFPAMEGSGLYSVLHCLPQTKTSSCFSSRSAVSPAFLSLHALQSRNLHFA